MHTSQISQYKDSMDIVSMPNQFAHVLLYTEIPHLDDVLWSC